MFSHLLQPADEKSLNIHVVNLASIRLPLIAKKKYDASSGYLKMNITQTGLKTGRPTDSLCNAGRHGQHPGVLLCKFVNLHEFRRPTDK